MINNFEKFGNQLSTIRTAPLVMTPAYFADFIGLPLSVLEAQMSRGYWPTLRVGKRIFVNCEALRLKLAERATEFSL